MCDIFNTFLREVIYLSGGSESEGAAIATFFFLFFILACLVAYTVFASVVIIEYSDAVDTNKNRELSKAISTAVLYSLGVAFYFVGDNIGYVITQYGDVVNCEQQCQANFRTAGVVFLGLALICYHLLPPVFNEGFEALFFNGKENHKHTPKAWRRLIECVVIIPKIDVLYSAIVTMSEANNEICGPADLGISIAFTVIFNLIGCTMIILYGVYAVTIIKKMRHDNNKLINKRYRFLSILIAVTTCFIFILHFLADNDLPLDCARKCETNSNPGNGTESPNLTSMIMTCSNDRDISLVRLGFTIVTLVAVYIILKLIPLVFAEDTKIEKSIYSTK